MKPFWFKSVIKSRKEGKMKRARAIVIVASFLFQSVLFLYSYQISYQELINTSQEEFKKKWEDRLKEYPVPKNAIELERKFSYPSKDLEREGNYFYSPMFIEHDSSGNIFVSDSGWNRMIKFDSSGNFVKTFGIKFTRFSK